MDPSTVIGWGLAVIVGCIAVAAVIALGATIYNMVT